MLGYIRTNLNLTNSYILFHLTIYEENTRIKYIIIRIKYLSF
jgi:hypothetical protein